MADLTITVTINDTDQKVMKNDLTDLNAWVVQALEGKKNHCWTRFQNEWTTKLMNDETFTDHLPSVKEDFVNLVTARADYKDRATREAEAEAARVAARG
jgi:hypothetical protein|tara:strand:- start:47 stop:343 length:297 start_codon:yes stop_codon:yes gene_type:complete